LKYLITESELDIIDCYAHLMTVDAVHQHLDCQCHWIHLCH